MHSFKKDRVGAVYSVRNQGKTVDEHTTIHTTELHPPIPKTATKKLGFWQQSTHTLEQLAPKTRPSYGIQTIEMLLDGKLRGLSGAQPSQLNMPKTSNLRQKCQSMSHECQCAQLVP
jgi:hypothetical protein